MHEKDIQKALQELKSEDPEIRLKGAKALGSLGAAAGEAAPELIALLGDIWIQTTVIWALREMKEGVKTGLVALIESLKNEDLFIRKSAAELLGNIGHEAEPCVLKPS
ncbi:MAG: hypothetical protein COT17_08560 [Elusimicrobia bacterium CG08_land_8_20_14_0_20_51_18]|nr:MAG: hypothetical protein COT17_08560 [Elusimicrobia bacterium CG08_land_8_20_14_0_20_51_18]